MILKEKEKTVIQDLQTQEKSCVEKYGRYAEQAKDPELKNLFQTIQKEEQKHYDSLTQVLDGQVPQCDCNDSNGKDYEPKQTYKMMDDSEDKKNDKFLATDCIGTEKLVSRRDALQVQGCKWNGVGSLLMGTEVPDPLGQI